VVLTDIVARNVRVHMERDNLRNIPRARLPAGVQVHWYRSGDEQKWVDIHRRAEKLVKVTLADHVRVFEERVEQLRRRQCFFLDADYAPIATATAWYENDFFGLPYGRVHWVAVVPRFQRRGLAKSLMAVVLRRMVELGHERAFLRTSTARLPAIQLYQKFGFRPSLRSEGERSVWQQLNERLPQPFALESVSDEERPNDSGESREAEQE
jgi:GNAT superfamily N-acetyltransferase